MHWKIFVFVSCAFGLVLTAKSEKYLDLNLAFTAAAYGLLSLKFRAQLLL